jgi:hypothetical protein
VTQDAFEPGPNNDYPAFPRLLDGSPAWSDNPETDGARVAGRGPDGLVTLQPRGVRYIRRDGERIAVDVTPCGPGGEPINPSILLR